MLTARERLLADLKLGAKEFSTGELLEWKIRVMENPYRGGEDMLGFSNDVVKMLDEEIASREIEVESVETDREKLIRLFGKENPTWNELVDAGYTFASGKKIVKEGGL